MAKGIKPTFGVEPDPTHYEQYAHSLLEFGHIDDRCRWIGTGCQVEYPHNEGALEEKVDKAQGRKTRGGGY